MEETKKFCVYAADDHEAYIVRLDEPERYYEINRNQLVEDRRPLAEQAMINAKYRKYLGPELNEFLLEWAEKDYPERVDKARASLEKAKEVAKRTLCDLFIEEKES